MPATRSCVCGLPGLSTITTRAGVVVGAPSAGRAGVPRCQPPNAFSASARSSAIEMSPGDDQRGVVRHEVLLPERHHVVARHAP